MSATSSTAQRQQAQEQGLIVGLITLPFRVFGVLCGSLLLSILIECVGMHVFWPEQGWHHAQAMLYFELEQFSDYFRRSVMVEEPGQSAQALIEDTYDTLLVDSGALDWVLEHSARAHAEGANAHGVQSLPQRLYINVEAYFLAAFYTLLTFLLRLMVLLLSVPLFVTAAFVGLVDGLVRRDVRRFGAGLESGFVYHRARACILPIVVLPWVIYLALPVSVSPLLILVPSAGLLGLAIDIAAGSFKKYL